MKWLELRVPPPAVMAVVGLLMWLAARAFPQVDFQLPARGPLAIAIALIGLAIAIVAVFQFRRAGTTPNPMKPGKRATVVVSGVYCYSRNPMYVGDLLILAGWALWLANAAAFLGLPLFVAYLNRFQIAAEERALQARFGAAYDAYRAAVRRWL
ncbi:MAG TPA: isoprenylcysteine carboxylmethyltransferase family protein [Burkholderiales bacterium]|nr:isoprenylcysteine carboxylmethyltransferase family protein [Burkholderiales bacterium]